MLAVELRGVSFIRDGQGLLSGVSFGLEAGECCVMLGPNGAGKSSIASIIAGRLWPSTGAVFVLGQRYGNVDLRSFRTNIGYFQPALQERTAVYHSLMSALDVICTGATNSLALYDEPAPAVRARARALFAEHARQTGTGFPLSRPYARLSSGERRKTLLLRTLMAEPPILLLDEPYESLDIPSRLEVETMLEDYLRSRSVTTLMILHRIEEIPPVATQVAFVRKGQLIRRGPIRDVLVDDLVSELYSVPLRVGWHGKRAYCVPVARDKHEQL